MAVVAPIPDELTAILAASPGALLTLSSAGTVLSANPAAVRLFARPRAELEGSHWHEWLPSTASSHTRARVEHLLLEAGDATAAAGTDLVLTTGAGTPRAVTMSCSDYWYAGERRLVVSLLPRPNPGATDPLIADHAQANAVLVDQAAVGMSLSDLNGRWLRVNEAYASMLGYAVDELIDMGFADVTHPDDRDRDDYELGRLKAGIIRRFSLEKRYIHRNGKVFWVRVHVSGVFEGDELVYWATQVVDIDAEHRAVENNRALQLMLESFVEHVPANIAVQDRDGRYTLVNENFAHAVGRDRDVLRGRTPAELGVERSAIAGTPDDEKQVIEKGIIVDREIVGGPSGDTTMWVTRFPVRETGGAIAGCGSISIDITDSKRNEQELLAQARTIGLLQRVAVAVNEAADARLAMSACLQLVCQYMEWPCGHVSLPDAGGDALVSSGIVVAPGTDAQRTALLEAFAHRDDDCGVAGRAWSLAAPCDDHAADNALRSFGLEGAAAFPLELDGRVVAVFEFYAGAPIRFSDRMLELLAFVGVQVGHALQREASEREAALALKQLSYHIDNTAAGVVEVDRDFRIVTWSPKCAELFGWTADEVMGLTPMEVGMIHPDDISLVTDAFGQVENQEVTAYRLFHRNLTKSGETIHVSWYNSLLRDDDGNAASTLAIAVDRTVEVKTQRALEEERQIFVAGPTLVMRWRDGPGWPIEYVSPNAESITGYATDEFASNAVRLVDFVHPDDVERVSAQVNALQRKPGSQRTLDPYRAITKSGDVIWLQTYVSCLEIPGETCHLVSYSVDITNMVALQAETRRQEQRLRNVIEATAVGTWEWNVATGEVGINERWAAILGYTRAELEPVTFDTWQRFAHPDDLEPTLAALEDNLSRISQQYLRDCRMRHKDGHWVWVLSRGNITEFDASGAPLKVAGIILDISEQKAAEVTILETNEALKRSNIELERFAYVASHDLQEPLRMVASFTQLLQKKYSDQLDDTAREYLQFAFDGAQRMQQLIRDLLTYSRLGRQDIDEIPVDLAALMARVMQTLQLAIDDSGARIECGDLPVVRGDAGQLHRLLQNLIGNAIKYHGSERPCIRVYTETRDDDTVFCVRDNGIGIDVEQSDRVFEIFQRLHSRADYPGTGIGLSVCKRIVERHGGRIWFEPAPDGGTVFCFTLAADRFAALRVVHDDGA
tara:strand:+ start:4477 stop:8025 length:3549 start_codon:yes stop_codon:yes gene_type:complete